MCVVYYLIYTKSQLGFIYYTNTDKSGIIDGQQLIGK